MGFFLEILVGGRAGTKVVLTSHFYWRFSFGRSCLSDWCFQESSFCIYLSFYGWLVDNQIGRAIVDIGSLFSIREKLVISSIPFVFRSILSIYGHFILSSHSFLFPFKKKKLMPEFISKFLKFMLLMIQSNLFGKKLFFHFLELYWFTLYLLHLMLLVSCHLDDWIFNFNQGFIKMLKFYCVISLFFFKLVLLCLWNILLFFDFTINIWYKIFELFELFITIFQ